MRRKNYYFLSGTQARGRRFPLELCICIWLLLDRFNAPAWLFYAFAIVCFIMLVLFLMDIFIYKQKPVDIQKLLSNIYEGIKQDETITKEVKE